jgi:hypothetical protein
MYVDFIHLAQDRMRSYEHSTENLNSLKDGEFTD